MGRRALIWMVAAAGLGVSFAAGFEIHQQSAVSPSSQPEPPSRLARVPLRDEVLGELERFYYRTLPPGVSGAPDVPTMIAGLDDPYTEYLSPADFHELQRSEAGSYSGVGVALTSGRRGLVVTASLPGLPAQRAGIQPGDVITTIDGTSLASLPYGRAVELIHGTAGSRVELTLIRAGSDELVHLTLERRPIQVPIVSVRSIRGRDGQRVEYVRLPGFPQNAAEVVRKLAQLARDRGAAGLVLDLRGNVGGLVSEAVGVAGVFVDRGVVVTTAGLHEPEQVFSAEDDAVRGLPVVVLVDGATASAAEVVAGALQRQHCALVVGSRTYGKGSVQAVHQLSNGGALKLTVATFRLAGGSPVDGRGIRPDVRARDREQTARDEVLDAALAELLGPTAR